MPLFKKKLSDTKVGKWLKEKAPDILDSVGNILPDKGGLGIIKNIIEKDPALTPEEQEFALKLIELDMKEQEGISERWNADMKSDSWLSKNVRPIILLTSWSVLILLVIVAWFGITISDSYISLFEVLAVTVNAAYFGGRTFEKYTTMKR